VTGAETAKDIREKIEIIKLNTEKARALKELAKAEGRPESVPTPQGSPTNSPTAPAQTASTASPTNSPATGTKPAGTGATVSAPGSSAGTKFGFTALGLGVGAIGGGILASKMLRRRPGSGP
jgi:hypothetical protein